MGSRVHEFMGSWAHGFKGSWVHGLKSSRAQEFKSSEVQRFRGSEVQRFRGSEVEKGSVDCRRSIPTSWGSTPHVVRCSIAATRLSNWALFEHCIAEPELLK